MNFLKMRVVFAGTPEFAKLALEALHQAGHELSLVLTQPDRPAGRGMKLQASAVKQYALEQGMAVVQPRSLRLDGKYPDEAHAAKKALEAAQPDVMIVAAYGLILPQWVLNLPRLGCLNIHASLLPRWRGAAPIHRSIEAGDTQTGITIMQMDAGLDTGDMLLVEKLPISEQDTTPTLHDKLAALGGQMIVQTLALAEQGKLRAIPQPSEGVNYASKIDKAESTIDWSLSAPSIARKIRAFTPQPGCSAALRGELVKFCEAICYENNSKLSNKMNGVLPKSVLNSNAEGIDVLCAGGSVLRITQLQRAGGKRLSAAEFLRGFPIAVGESFQ
jgi:methionyl-tRNA formyltransferase